MAWERVNRSNANTSRWEHDERAERYRHGAWLLLHGAPPGVVEAETGIKATELRRWGKKHGMGAGR